MQLCQSEVQNLHAAVAHDHDVLGLEVAMDDRSCVRGGKSMRDGARGLRRFARGEWSLGQQCPQCRAVDQFFDEIECARLP